MKESMSLFMPQNNLLVKEIEVRFTASVANNPRVLKNILARVRPSTMRHANSRANKMIRMVDVYNTYAQERIRAIVRQELAKHKIEDVATNRQAISITIFNELRKQLKKIGSPIRVTQFSLAKFNPPKTIVAAYELAEQRRIDLSRVDAEKDLAIKRAEAALAVAHKQAEIRLAKAEAFRLEAKAMAKAITPQWLKMRQMEVQELMAKNPNTVFYPMQFGLGKALSMRSAQHLGRIAGPRASNPSK